MITFMTHCARVLARKLARLKVSTRVHPEVPSNETPCSGAVLADNTSRGTCIRRERLSRDTRDNKRLLYEPAGFATVSNKGRRRVSEKRPREKERRLKEKGDLGKKREA